MLAGIGPWLHGRGAAAADFYQGKTLTVIVGYAPGGGVDATARAITRHFARFIPGNPTVVGAEHGGRRRHRVGAIIWTGASRPTG